MKKIYTNKACLNCKVAAILLMLLLNINIALTQDTTVTNKKIHLCLTIGIGTGTGFPSEYHEYGLGSMCEVTILTKKSVYTVGIRRIAAFQMIGFSYPNNSINSLDISYGKILTHNTFLSSLNIGVGFIEGITKGKYLGGSTLISEGNFEKIKFYTVGIPISAKIAWVPFRFHGVGMELYANLNLKNTFYGINLSNQLGELRTPQKKTKTKI